MDFPAALLPLFKIAAVFATMLGGIRLKIGLGLSILCGGLLTGALFGLPVAMWPQTALSGVLNDKTIFLVAIVALIMILSNLLEKTGQSARLMDALSAYLREPKLRLLFFPALIGLLPMPGGAVFSAPMVDSVSRGMGLSREDKVLVNYWFRHIWEIAWPLYPGIILASSLSGVPITRLVLHTCPGIFLCLFLGWRFVLAPVMRRLPSRTAEATDTPRNPMRALREGLPLVIAIAGAIGMEAVLSAFAPDVHFEIGIIIALAASILCAVIQNGLPIAPIRSTLTGRYLWSMLWVVASIFIFKQFMEDSGVVTELSQLAGGTAALIVATVCLPLLVGIISGITMAYVGSTFPLMLGMLAQLGMEGQTLQYTVLALFSGFTGIMVSPLHICFLLTCRYFEADMARAWRGLLAPCSLVMLFGWVWFAFLRA
ncbi:hypothetical protein GGQ74_000174 [Desulfobaculum xiamenense]|uniref:DUF401 family protein n=1 Tax=Desulfobaculum xiamenense TaxID=995050 RepID=A0A846QMR5_9BACT|nr:DUF401 family protein [Desulfobaculum xiamenense]NJB66534.1 hypothetical protein [Desulfobaculum xiamenense]